MVPLLTAAGIPLTDPTEVPLRVVTRSTAVHDPLRVSGSNVVYGDVEAALGHAVASATVPWADRHKSIRARRMAGSSSSRSRTRRRPTTTTA